MTKYVAYATGYDLWGRHQVFGADTVTEDASNAPIKTGLLNAEGTPLYRMPERRPIGFCLAKEGRDA